MPAPIGIVADGGVGMADEALTAVDRLEVLSLMAARQRVAMLFTATTTAAVLLLLLRLVVRGVSVAEGDGTMLLMVALLAATSGAVAWRLGWRQVLALQRDVARGQKRVVHGVISDIERRPDAYGEVVTHATVDGLRVMGRGEGMSLVEAGDEVMVDLLPESGFVIGVRRVETD